MGETKPRVQATTSANGWRRFWERGTWWKAVLAAAIYLIVFQCLSTLIALAGRPVDSSSTNGLLLTLALPIALAGIALLAFAWSVGWLPELFGPQPIRGRRWMWIAVVVVLGTNLLRYLSIDYVAAGAPYVAAWVLTTVCIGFTEELATRGLAVTILRKAGHPEIAVAIVSSLIFAAMHAIALINGLTVFNTILVMIYTFFFGLLMYLVLRVTGSLVAVMLVHATTDMATSLMNGYPNADSPLLSVAGAGNFLVILAGLILVFFIRDRAANRGHVAVPGIYSSS